LSATLRLENISKSFGEIRSLVNIDFEVFPGEVVGLLGDNGAGKSTLIKVMTGYYQPDKGKLYWKGNRLERFSVSKSRELGIETVYQERALSDQHSIWRNLFMGRELTNRFKLLDIKRMKQEADSLMSQMKFTGASITSDKTVDTMSGGERQGIAISRALHFQTELIILDEPTMGLSLSETSKVLNFVGEIKSTGKSCIFIDHNIFHVYPVADRIVVLDRGYKVGEFTRGQLTLEELTEKLYHVARTGLML
jgi:simple sugar transport system ATP-binding protein